MLYALYILLAIFIVIAYTFVAGLIGTWLHTYLVNTTKGGEYNHDHRPCIIGGIFFVIPLLWLTWVYIGKFLEKVYGYPQQIYSAIQERRKKLESEKK